jgi:type VI secretion system secreted protein Hcp
MDIYLLDLSSAGIRGECRLEGYKDTIEALSFSYDTAFAASGRSGGADFSITKSLNVSSVALMDYCYQSKVIPSVTLTVGTRDGDLVTKGTVYTLTNSIITSISTSGGGGIPQETVTFSYTSISKRP